MHRPCGVFQQVRFLEELLDFSSGHLCKTSPTVPIALALELQLTTARDKYWMVLEVDLKVVQAEGAVHDSKRKPTLRFNPEGVSE